MINFKVVTPVNKPELEDDAIDENISSVIDIVSYEETSGEDDVRKLDMELSTQNVDEGGIGLTEIVPESISLETEILREQPTLTAVDEESSQDPIYDPVCEELTHNVVDEGLTRGVIEAESFEQLAHGAADEELTMDEQTSNALDVELSTQNVDEGGIGLTEIVPESISLETEILREQPTLTAVDEESSQEPIYDPVCEVLTHNVVDEGLTRGVIEAESFEQLAHGAADEELTMDEQTSNALDVEDVGDEESESTNMIDNVMDELPTYSSVDERPVEQPTHSAMDEQPIHTTINEEHVDLQTDTTVVEEPVELKTDTTVDEEPVHCEVESLKMSDANLPSSSRTEEIAEGNPQSGRSEDVSVYVAVGSQKVSTSENFLLSGVASMPHPSKVLAGGEDAYFVDQNWLGIADGVALWSLEGTGDGLYAQELMRNCGKSVADSKSITITEPTELLNKAAMETLSPGSCTALIAYFDDQTLHVANIGDSGFVIIRNGTIFKKSSPMEHEFNFPVLIENGDDLSELIEEYEIDVDEGDIIITGTYGVFDNLYEQEIASIVSTSLQANMKPQEIAKIIVRRAQEVGRSAYVRSPFAGAAQAAGYMGYTGGLIDDVTVIVSLVQPKSTHLL